MKFFVIFVEKKKWQVSVGRNKILFLASDTCHFFLLKIFTNTSLFFTFSTFLLKIANLIFEVWCQKNNCQVLIATECLVNTSKRYQLQKTKVPKKYSNFQKLKSKKC